MSGYGCYTLDLYCDMAESVIYPDKVHEYGEFPKTYTAEFGSECRKMARKDGWIIRRDGTVICPKCSKKVRNVQGVD